MANASIRFGFITVNPLTGERLPGFGSSADMGVIGRYRFADWLAADISLINGEGYKKLNSDNKYRYGIGVTLTPAKGLTVRGYFDNADKDIYETKQLRLMIVRLEDKTPVGLVDLYDFDPYHMRAGLGIMIHNMEHRKQGYASSAIRLMLDYCFENLGLHQVYSSIPSCNIASLKLFESLGFTKTGYRKEWLKRGDNWEDVIYFQQLASTWKQS